MENIAVEKLNENSILPSRSHCDDAGLDLYAAEGFVIEPGQGKMVSTGIAMEIPKGYVGMIADRSSMAKKGLKTAGGIVDSGYRGEVKVLLWNLSHQNYTVSPKDRVAQILLIPIATPVVQEVPQLSKTERGAGGFGSTGN